MHLRARSQRGRVQRRSRREKSLGVANRARGVHVLSRRGLEGLCFATTRTAGPAVDSVAEHATGYRMLTALIVILRSIGLMCRGHRAVALENLALRQQLAVLTRPRTRLPLRPRDRLFWILLAGAWREWRTALRIVQPDTVLRWHRHWLRRRWADRSKPVRPGRPRTDTAIRSLVEEMAAANPFWGAPRIHGELGKLGIAVSERTVSRLLPRRRAPGRRATPHPAPPPTRGARPLVAAEDLRVYTPAF